MNIKITPDTDHGKRKIKTGLTSMKVTKSSEGKLCVQNYPKYCTCVLSFLSQQNSTHVLLSSFDRCGKRVSEM